MAVMADPIGLNYDEQWSAAQKQMSWEPDTAKEVNG